MTDDGHEVVELGPRRIRPHAGEMIGTRFNADAPRTRAMGSKMLRFPRCAFAGLDIREVDPADRRPINSGLVVRKVHARIDPRVDAKGL